MRSEHITKHQCMKCDGSGLLPDTKATLSWNVTLCSSCNGYGFVLYNIADKKTVAYDKDASVSSKFNKATSRVRSIR